MQSGNVGRPTRRHRVEIRPILIHSHFEVVQQIAEAASQITSLDLLGAVLCKGMLDGEGCLVLVGYNLCYCY